MPAAWEGIDKNFVSAQPETTVRDLLEGARRQEGRIYTWVVAPLPDGRYAVTRINEIAFIAEEPGAAILDRTLEELGLLRPGGAVQASTDLSAAEMQALTSPGKRIPVLEGDEVLGVLNLGPQRPRLPGVDPWRLEGVTPIQWPYDALKLHHNFAILDPWADTDELLWWLGQAARGWLYLIVRKGADLYQVMAVDEALAHALRQYGPRYGVNRVDDLPLPAPVPAVEENSVEWGVVRGQILDTPARCLPITRGGRVIGVLAEPTRRAATLSEWKRALGGEPAPWVQAYEEMLGPPPTAGIEPPDEPAPPSGRPSFRPRPRRGHRTQATQRRRRGLRPQPQPPPPSPPPPQPVPGLKDESELPPPRYLNVGFFAADQETMQPADRPLALDGGPYCLGVNVGGTHWGIGEKLGPEYAVTHSLEDELEKLEEGEALGLLVVVRPRAIGRNLIKVPQPCQELYLPKRKDSDRVYFEITVTRPGQHALYVDLWYQGHPLQSQRIEFWVVEHASGEEPAVDVSPHRRVAWSRTGTLSQQSLQGLKRPSILTILVEREGPIELWVWDVEKRTLLGNQQPRLSDDVLNSLLGRMRKALQEVQNSYKGKIGREDSDLGGYLWQLAFVGAEFYRALLPAVANPQGGGPEGQIDELKLEYNQVIQVAALSMLPGVPWELLYDRPIETYDKGDAGLVRLCPDFRTHPPDKCPHHGDSEVVCPYGFWGYRYIIEQLPNWVPPKQPPPLADLPLVVRNGRPLRFVPVAFGWDNLKEHLDDLRALAEADEMDLEQEIMTKSALKAELVAPHRPADILYFYTHGGFDEYGPMVELGPKTAKDKFRASDLAAWKDRIDLSLHQPLVVFNACETAAFLPEHHESLPKGFADQGAAGVIGTQVKVFGPFAAYFIRLFFQRFLAKKNVGQALFETRRELLFDHYVEVDGGRQFRPDPRGLIYSLFSAADVELAQAVTEPD